MTKYAILASYTADSWAAMVDNPADRTPTIRSAAEAVGGSLESVYWMFGGHDVLVISDMPDSTSQAALSVAVASTGALSAVETHELIDAEGLRSILAAAKRAKSAYTPPGR
jgi:uncharacterized protein with GYD domain